MKTFLISTSLLIYAAQSPAAPVQWPPAERILDRYVDAAGGVAAHPGHRTTGTSTRAWS